jgi:hypothetical protein
VSKKTNNRGAVAGTLSEGVFTPGDNTMSFTLVDQNDGTFALRASNGKYLYAAASGSNHLKTQAEVNSDAKWTISSTSASAEGSSNRHVMQFNGGSSLFSCYASAGGNGMTAIAFYVPKPATPPTPAEDWTEGVRTGLEAGWYYTMCLNKAVTNVRGASIWRVLSMAANGKDVILEDVAGTLDAGRPYIFYATAASLDVVYTGDAVLTPVNDADNHGLIGSFSQELIAQSATNYIIYNNELYFVNSTAYVGANRAYLDMTAVPGYTPSSPAPGRQRVAMKVNGSQVATGMDQVPSDQVQSTKVLIDGQLYILRGEKMYDATGRLVK